MNSTTAVKNRPLTPRQREVLDAIMQRGSIHSGDAVNGCTVRWVTVTELSSRGLIEMDAWDDGGPTYAWYAAAKADVRVRREARYSKGGGECTVSGPYESVAQAQEAIADMRGLDEEFNAARAGQPGAEVLTATYRIGVNRATADGEPLYRHQGYFGPKS